MPASKKRVVETKKTSKTQAKASDKPKKATPKKPSPARPQSEKNQAAKPAKPRVNAAADQLESTTPVAPQSPPMPMPVAPHQLPTKSIQPLTKTTYNLPWLRRIVISFVVGLLMATGIFGWFNRQAIESMLGTAPVAPDEPYTLNATPAPTPDQSDLEELTEEWQLSQSSDSAQPSDPDATSPSRQLFEKLSSQNSVILEQQLDDFISKLESQGVNTTNLYHYRDKVEAAKRANNEQAAHEWLVEAVMHAHELELLKSYYSDKKSQ